MIENFVKEYAQMLAAYPDKIDVKKEVLDNKFSQITIFAKSEDAGRLIGKDGNMINAIKVFVNGCKAKDGTTYKVQVDTIS
jgi:predicted RNA-binding protein YlqC (UPF0109 family)